MPRRRDPEQEDLLVQCPRCDGVGTVLRIDLEEDAAVCDLCGGATRVTPAVRDRFRRARR